MILVYTRDLKHENAHSLFLIAEIIFVIFVPVVNLKFFSKKTCFQFSADVYATRLHSPGLDAPLGVSSILTLEKSCENCPILYLE